MNSFWHKRVSMQKSGIDKNQSIWKLMATGAVYWFGIPCLSVFFRKTLPADIAACFALLLSFILLYPIIRFGRNKEDYGIAGGHYDGIAGYMIPLVIICLVNIPYFFLEGSRQDNTILYAVAAGCIAGIYEELLFRSFLFQIFADDDGQKIAIIMTSIIFGAMHLMNLGSDLLYCTILQVIYSAFVGLIFAVVRSRTGSILLPVIVHSVLDLLSYIASIDQIWLDTGGTVVLCVAGLFCYKQYEKDCVKK